MAVVLSLLALVSFGVFAAQEPFEVWKKQSLMTMDYETGEIKYAKGADPKEVVELLVHEWHKLAGEYKKLQAACDKKVETPVKAPIKEKAPQLKGK